MIFFQMVKQRHPARFKSTFCAISLKSDCRNKSIMEAEAEAEAVALKGDAEAYAIEIKAKAEVGLMTTTWITIY